MTITRIETEGMKIIEVKTEEIVTAEEVTGL